MKRKGHAYRRIRRLDTQPLSGWPDEAVIQDRAQLRQWFARLRSAVSAGRLEQYKPEGARLATRRTVLELTDEAGWPRYIEWYFRDQQGKCYHFIAEIYNGTYATGRIFRTSKSFAM